MAKRLPLVAFASVVLGGSLHSAAAIAGPPTNLISELAPDSISAELRYDTAIETKDGEHSLSRLTITPEAKWRFGRHWLAETSLRIELADDNTGLGNTDGYSNLSEPFVDNKHLRVELDRAHLTWRASSTRLRIGKQVTAWGVLDGVRVTDRFDAVRRRDFIYTDVRPERIARWGIQARTELGAWTVEVSSALDPTVSQQANVQDAFAPSALRFTGGINLRALANSSPLPVRTSGRNAYGRDLTYGLRSSRDVGAGRMSLLAFRGPTTDPVLEWAGGAPGAEIELRHPNRSLFGATLDYTLGDAVVRAELAYIPDQQANLLSGIALAVTEQKRWLAGVGLDVNGPFGVFITAQLAIDHMAEGDTSLTRPQTDLIGTLRLQRSFPQAGFRLQAEWLGSLTDGDAVIRPQLNRELNDKLSLSVGGDFALGDRQGVFGQFRPQSRGWLRLQLKL